VSEQDSTLVLLHEPDWYEQLASWNDLVSRCERKPSRKRIHALRIATLRLKAQTECWLRQVGAEDARARAAQHWMKQADKLRKVMSSVRDLDVFLQTLARLRGPEAALPADAPVASRNFVQEMDRLEVWLKRRRRSADKKLGPALAKKMPALQEASAEMQAHFRVSEPPSIHIAEGVEAIVAELAAAAPALSAETLHEFRKRAKAARYLAEIDAPRVGLARRQVALFKKIQVDVGRWHDWQALADEAKGVLSVRGEEGLQSTLESMAERALQEAVRTCQNAVRQLAALKAPGPERAAQFSRRKPVVRVAPANTGIRRNA